jgi:hypothetical protein
MQFKDKSLAEFLATIEIHVAALNEAVDAIPRDRIRLHCCWGNWEGPHHHDLPLAKIIDLAFAARPQAISIEAANPRHEHEWEDLREISIPDDKILIPGVIDSTTNFVEHPAVVANRICEAVAAVGELAGQRPVELRPVAAHPPEVPDEATRLPEVGDAPAADERDDHAVGGGQPGQHLGHPRRRDGGRRVVDQLGEDAVVVAGHQQRAAGGDLGQRGVQLRCHPVAPARPSAWARSASKKEVAQCSRSFLAR